MGTFPPRRILRIVIATPVVAGVCLLLWIHLPRGAHPDQRFLRHRGSLVDARVLERSESEGIVSEEVLLTGSTGMRFTARIQVPVRAAGPVPALLMQGGFRTGRDVITHVPRDRPPLVLASLDYQFAFPARQSIPSRLASLPELTESAERTVAAALLLLDYLESREEVDVSRTLLVGGSLGGFFATVEAALEPRFEGLVLICIGGDVEDIVSRNLGGVPAGLAPVTARLLRPWLGPLDPLHFVDRLAPRPLLLINAANDTRIPAASVQALLHRAGEPKESVWIEAPHRIQGDAELTAETLDLVLAWMRRQQWL